MSDLVDALSKQLPKIHLLHFAPLCYAFGDSDSGGDRDSDMDLGVIVEFVKFLCMSFLYVYS